MAATRTQIMRNAWIIARTAVKLYGGTVREYFPACLRMAWQGVDLNAYLIEVLPYPVIDLDGSPKQVAWAQDIIRRLCDDARNEMYTRAYHANACHKVVGRWTQLTAYLSHMRAARWWIDYRTTSITYICRQWMQECPLSGNLHTDVMDNSPNLIGTVETIPQGTTRRSTLLCRWGADLDLATVGIPTEHVKAVYRAIVAYLATILDATWWIDAMQYQTLVDCILDDPHLDGLRKRIADYGKSVAA